MRIKNYLKSIIGAVITATALVSGAASAEITGYTGTVVNSLTGVGGYTFATVVTPAGGGVSAYYYGNNSAIATILDNAKRLDQVVTVYVDNATRKITLVQ